MKASLFAALIAMDLLVPAASTLAGGDAPPWKQPMPCVERIPARTVPGMPP